MTEVFRPISILLHRWSSTKNIFALQPQDKPPHQLDFDVELPENVICNRAGPFSIH